MKENSKTALLVIDMQNDFCTGGSLAVNGSLEIIPLINKIRDLKNFDYTVYSQDWHPEDHISFNTCPFISTVNDQELDEISRKYKGAFPVHCVQGSFGAEFHKELNCQNVDFIVQKGQNKLVESFSAFGNPNLLAFLKEKGVGTVYVCGLAYDFCVGSTAADAAESGFTAYVLKDLSRGISQQTTDNMENRFKNTGVKVINSEEI